MQWMATLTQFADDLWQQQIRTTDRRVQDLISSSHIKSTNATLYTGLKATQQIT